MLSINFYPLCKYQCSINRNILFCYHLLCFYWFCYSFYLFINFLFSHKADTPKNKEQFFSHLLYRDKTARTDHHWH